jgi:hypothetical protein
MFYLPAGIPVSTDTCIFVQLAVQFNLLQNKPNKKNNKSHRQAGATLYFFTFSKSKQINS